MKLIGSIPWAVVGEKWLVTLTYPPEFPADGRVVKRHLEAFKMRFERAYGKQVVAVWKMNFNAGGRLTFTC